MEALGRVELPTNGLGNRCSIHLSYRAARRNRLVYISLPQRGIAIRLILLPNCCPIAEWRLPTSPSQQVHRLEQSWRNTCSLCSRWRDAVSPEWSSQGFQEHTNCYPAHAEQRANRAKASPSWLS